MLAYSLNTINEKGIKYVVKQNAGAVSLTFGLVMAGERNLVEIVPSEKEVKVAIKSADNKSAVGSEVTFVEKEVEKKLPVFLDKVVELKALQEQESSLAEEIKHFS